MKSLIHRMTDGSTSNLFSLYEVQELSGIDAEVLAGLIEANRLPATIQDGEYKINAASIEEYANDLIFQML